MKSRSTSIPRQHSGTAVMSEADAAQYSLQAARLLEKLAITRGHALDVSVAEAGLLTALSDSRPEIAKAAGNVLGTLRSKSAQNGLAMKANNESTPTEVRVSLYQSLAESAKYIGNHLADNENRGIGEGRFHEHRLRRPRRRRRSSRSPESSGRSGQNPDSQAIAIVKRDKAPHDRGAFSPF